MVFRNGGGSIGDWCRNFSHQWSGGGVDRGCNLSHWNCCLHNCSGCGSVDNGVESIDWISGVGDSSDGAIGFHKTVLSLNDIPIPGLSSGLGISGQTIRDRVPIVVLWVRVIGFGRDGHSFGYWNSGPQDGCGSPKDWSSRGMGISDRGVGSICNWGSSDGRCRVVLSIAIT